MLPIRNISYLLPVCCSFWEKCKNSPETGLGCSTHLTLKEPGYFDPSHSRGAADSAPLKISETDRWNIKCVVLVDSYDPSESIGTKKIQNIPCMTSQWRHKWRHVKNTKITKNRQNHGFSLFFQAKVAFFSNDVCQSMLTHVLTPNKPNK